MSGNHLHAKEFVIGATVGSLLGSVAALLVAPKAGKDLRDDLCDTYCNIADKTEDLACRGKSFAKSFGSQATDWSRKAKCCAGDAKKSFNKWRGVEEEETDSTRELLIGGLVGGLVGVAIGLLLAPKPGEELRHDIANAYEDITDRGHDFADSMSKKGKYFAKNARSGANKWLDLAKDLVENLTDEVHESGEHWAERIKDLVGNKRANDVIDWARFGYKVWEGIRGNKR